MTRPAIIPTLAAMRLGVGVGTWLAPNQSMRLIGMGKGVRISR